MKFILLVAVLSSFGCVKLKDDKIVETGSISPNFHGTWETCLTDAGESIKIRQVISSSSVVHAEIFYETSSCTGSSPVVQIESVNKVKKESPLTLRMSKTELTPLNSDMVDTFNNGFLCAYQNWTQGVPYDVTGWDCGGDLDFSDTTPFEVYYTRNGNNLNVSDGDGGQFTLTLVQ